MTGEELGKAMVATLAFSAMGLLLFLICFGIIKKLAGFSIRKEIEHDQNVALAVLIGAVIIGISMIVAAAVHGA